MTQEEKAKLYDELKVKAQELAEDGYIDKLALVDMFPELKESKDEKIRKALIEAIRNNYTLTGYINHIPTKDILAWLEKQGEHANFRNEIQVGDKVTRNEDGVLVNLSQLKRVAKPAEEYNITGIRSKNAQGKLGEMIKKLKPVNEVLEQNSADKGKPKFNVRDWVIDKQGIVHQIANVIENVTYHTYGYDIVGGGYFNDNTEGVRLWTIQDAKDGDVLADGVGVILFRKIGNKKDANVVDYHCAVFKSGSFIIQKGVSYWGYSNDEQLRPATKEQCERFFATMRDVGYEWDADKKGLKKLREE